MREFFGFKLAEVKIVAEVFIVSMTVGKLTSLTLLHHLYNGNSCCIISEGVVRSKL
jgi:hypothetical protein